MAHHDGGVVARLTQLLFQRRRRPQTHTLRSRKSFGDRIRRPMIEDSYMPIEKTSHLDERCGIGPRTEHEQSRRQRNPRDEKARSLAVDVRELHVASGRAGSESLERDL